MISVAAVDNEQRFEDQHHEIDSFQALENTSPARLS